MGRSQLLLRAIAMAALAAALVVVVFVLFRGATAYVVNVRFTDAGQLVKGDLVEVGGSRIGTITDIELTDHNQANIRLSITDGEYNPLREGTIATIRQVGQAGITNRYIELTPGDGEEIADGGVIESSRTQPAVDLDQLFSALDPEARADFRSVIDNSAKIFAGTALDANESFAYLSPVMAELSAFSDDVVQDQVALETLLAATAKTSRAIASRSSDLQNGIAATNTALGAVATETDSLESVLDRAPALFERTGRSLTALRSTIRSIIPDGLEETAPELERVLRLLTPTLRGLRPALTDVRAALPATRRALAEARPLERVAVPALQSTRTAIGDSLPIFADIRPYAPDLITGLALGFGGSTGGYYDANGHYARISLNTGASGFAALSALVPALNLGATGPNNGQRTRLFARCPGGAAEPAPDGSNPYAGGTTCNLDHNHRP